MKQLIIVVGAALLWPSSIAAQEESAVGSVSGYPESSTAAPVEAPPAEAPPEEEKKRSLYSRKVRGFLWLEAIFGPTSYDPDQFGSLDLGGVVPNAPKLRGPEYGIAGGIALGGFFIGPFYRQANYDLYKLMRVGVDIQGVFRFIPFVHPMVRLDFFYSRTFDGNPFGLNNTNVDGGGLTAGVGVRVPVIRWISIAATFDWSFIGLVVRGDLPGSTERFRSGVTGQQLGATFALTFHFLGVGKD